MSTTLLPSDQPEAFAQQLRQKEIDYLPTSKVSSGPNPRASEKILTIIEPFLKQSNKPPQDNRPRNPPSQ